jgi:hypothetical protein
MPRKPRNRTEDPKQGGTIGSSQSESDLTAERGPTESVSTRNPLPQAQKRARNADEKQQSGTRGAHAHGGDERASIHEAAHGRRRRPERRRTRDGSSENPGERESSNGGKQNDWSGDAAMRSTSQVPPRKFDLMTASGLSDEAREAANAAFDAMSDWRTEAAESNERHLAKVIDKMAAAARALGWPEAIVDATRTQMQNIAKMQTQMMDRMMDAWEEQIKAPNPMTGDPSAMLSRLNSLSSFGPTASQQSTAGSSIEAMNPFKFWANVAEQWQKASADAMSFWDQGRKAGDAGGRKPLT